MTTTNKRRRPTFWHSRNAVSVGPSVRAACLHHISKSGETGFVPNLRLLAHLGLRESGWGRRRKTEPRRTIYGSGISSLLPPPPPTAADAATRRRSLQPVLSNPHPFAGEEGLISSIGNLPSLEAKETRSVLPRARREGGSQCPCLLLPFEQVKKCLRALSEAFGNKTCFDLRRWFGE